MMLIDFLYLTTCEQIRIVEGGKALFIGKVDETPYKYMRRKILAFGFILDELEIALQVAV